LCFLVAGAAAAQVARPQLYEAAAAAVVVRKFLQPFTYQQTKL
jgi:hypothetical protein